MAGPGDFVYVSGYDPSMGMANGWNGGQMPSYPPNYAAPCETQCEPAAPWARSCSRSGVNSTHQWTIDYRYRELVDSSTSYAFGTGTDPGWDPLSKLDWPLDSKWHGLQIGYKTLNWEVRCEWLTPINREIDGQMADYDWIPADNLISHTLSDQRWNEGHMVDLGGQFKLVDGGLEIWPTLGFRYQQFDITASGINYIEPPDGILPEFVGVDVITFDQHYYQFYLGCQFRKTINCWITDVTLTLQADVAAVTAHNIDHHLVREGGDRYTIEHTAGSGYHFAFIAEAPVMRCLTVGFQFDHTGMRTSGKHRLDWVSQGIDETWNQGVVVKSSQTMLTGYVQARF